MDDHQEALKRFRDYCNSNYNKDRKKAIKACNGDRMEGEDVLHEAYESVQKRIEKKGFEGDFASYVFLCIRNRAINRHKERQKTPKVDIDSCQIQEEFDESTALRLKKEFFAQDLFHYVNSTFGDHDGSLFRYKYEVNKGIKKISQMTGLNESYIWKTLKKIREHLAEKKSHEYQLIFGNNENTDWA